MSESATGAQVGSQVLWSAYGEPLKGKVIELDSHDGRMMIAAQDGMPWQARKTASGDFAYSGNNQCTLPITVIG